MPGTRKLGRDTTHRTAILRGMVTFLLESDKIETIVTHAKEVCSLTKKPITLAQGNNLHNQRMALSFITKENVTHELFSETAPKCTDHKSGCTRITRIGPRRGDAVKMAIIELI